MYLRKYHPSDCAALAALFYETIHTVNARDYPQEQLDAWADGHVDLDAWNESFLAHNTYVAVQECVDADDIDSRASDSTDTAPGKTGGSPANALIIGFGDMDDTGYLDHLFVRWDCQGRGVATALCDALEEHCRDLGLAAVTVHASKTALPFFLHRGYRVEREQQVPVRGQVLANYAMHKELRR